MPQRLNRFLVVLTIVLFQLEIQGQDFRYVPVKPMRHTLFIQPEFGFRPPGKTPVSVFFFGKSTFAGPAQPYFSVKQVISQSCYADRLGFICRQELRFENKTGLPLRFRLGSLDYVNWMEQKPNAINQR